MNKIPTAEEMEQSGKYDSYEAMMIEFAKLHVKAALKAASEKVYIMDERDGDSGEGAIYVDEKSILNAYPLTNII